MYLKIILGISIYIVLFVIFTSGIYWSDNKKQESKKKETMKLIPEAPIKENKKDLMMEYGYEGDDMPWTEVLKFSELDRATFQNHKNFVKDVRRFSSGSNFTSVADDNTNAAFTNFVGLRRPQHVPIGESARQIPDVDQTVLQRNKKFIFNSSNY